MAIIDDQLLLMSILSLAFLVLSASMLPSSPLIISAAAAATRKIPAIFTFGDSLADVGNNAILKLPTSPANLAPYGSSGFGKGSGRFCDGRLVGDYLASFLQLPSAPPSLRWPGASAQFGLNFAVAGAGALEATSKLFRAISLPAQVKSFKQYLDKSKRPAAVISKSLFVVVIGGNDYFRYATAEPKPPLADYIRSVVQGAVDAIKTLYSLGARKILAVNVGPLGCTPIIVAFSNVTSGCSAQANGLIQLHNAAYSIALTALRSQLKGASLIEIDLFNMFREVSFGAKKYGFVSTTHACCGGPPPVKGLVQCGKSAKIGGVLIKSTKCSNPSKYVFFDQLHPSQRTNLLASYMAWRGDLRFARPFNIRTLAARS